MRMGNFEGKGGGPLDGGLMIVQQSREWVDGSWVMGQMGHENRMGHVGHGSLGVDP